jgi:hypothetical protein
LFCGHSFGGLRGQDFDGDDAVEAGVFGAVHLTHSTRPNGSENSVRT